MDNTAEINKILARMSKFAATTKDDRLSVVVSRAAQRLANQPGVRGVTHTLADERPLTRSELAVIQPFMRERPELDAA